MSDSYSDFPSYVEQSSPKPKLLLIFVIVLILIILALGGLYLLGATKSKNLLQVIPSAPTPTAAAAAIPTATLVITQPPLDRKSLTIAILNGSGTAGAAKGTSSYLTGLGYTIGPIANADKFTYTGITVHVKKAQSAYLAQLQKDLLDNDPKASISASVDDTIKTDAEVIVGK